MKYIRIMKKEILLTIFISVFVSHVDSRHNSYISQRSLSPKIQIIDIESVSPRFNPFIMFPKEMKELNDNSRIGNIVIYKTGDTLEILSTGTFTYNLLGYDKSPEGLSHSLGLKMNVEDIIIDTGEEEDEIIKKNTYKKSFIKVYFNPELGYYNITSAKILDKEFSLLYDIHIGMSKMSFFKKIFKDSTTYDFSKIKVFINTDDFGDIISSYIFENDVLKEIIINSNCEWDTFNRGIQ